MGGADVDAGAAKLPSVRHERRVLVLFDDLVAELVAVHMLLFVLAGYIASGLRCTTAGHHVMLMLIDLTCV